MPNTPSPQNASVLWQTAMKEQIDEKGLSALVPFLADIRDAQLQTVERLDRMESNEAARDIKMDEVFNAFPGKDADAHRRFHEAIIENTLEKKRLRAAIMEKTISGLVWSIIVGVAICIWDYLLHKFSGK